MQAMNNMASRLLDAAGQWFYSEEEGIPCIWQDLYYISHKNTDNPINGFFHIMVLLPRKGRSDAGVGLLPDSQRHLGTADIQGCCVMVHGLGQ